MANSVEEELTSTIDTDIVLDEDDEGDLFEFENRPDRYEPN